MFFGTVVKEKDCAVCGNSGGRCAVFFGNFSSLAHILRMRLAHTENFTKSEPTFFSLINIPYKTGIMFGLFDPFQPNEYRDADIVPVISS